MDGRLHASSLRTSIDLYLMWQAHRGYSTAPEMARLRALKGRPLTDRVFNAFPAFAAAAIGGFYGALHVTMEDGNLEDDYVEAAVRDATEEGGASEIALARTLQAMTYAERVALYLSLSPFEETMFNHERDP